MNRSQMIESKYASTLSSGEISESNRDPISDSNKKDNSSFYNQINKIKKKWENFSNNSKISNLNETMDLNRSNISRNENIRLFDNQSNNNNNNLNTSQMTIKELKNKWNEVSTRTSINSNRQNLNGSSMNMNDISMHSTNQNSNSNIENKRKSFKK